MRFLVRCGRLVRKVACRAFTTFILSAVGTVLPIKRLTAAPERLRWTYADMGILCSRARAEYSRRAIPYQVCRRATRSRKPSSPRRT